MPVMHTTIPSRSPLEPVFAGYPRIPFAFAEQFLHGDDLPYGMTLDGVMHRIWHRPAVLGPLFWALGKIGVLVPYNAVDVPTTLVVRPGRDHRDGVYHVWDRTLTFPDPIRFRTTIVYDPASGKVVDLVGPRDVLYMVWDAEVPPARPVHPGHPLLRLPIRPVETLDAALGVEAPPGDGDVHPDSQGAGRRHGVGRFADHAPALRPDLRICGDLPYGPYGGGMSRSDPGPNGRRLDRPVI